MAEDEVATDEHSRIERCWDGSTCSVSDCTACPALVESRSQIVSGVGPLDAELLFVGEGPGAREDEQGEPFVGRSGDVLDDGLRAVGLARQDVRISNCVRCRPPENRDPTVEELANCRGFLENEIVCLDPALVVALGKVPAENLLGRSVSVTTEAGSIEEIHVAGESHKLLISVHPAATLYDPNQKETFAATLQTAVEYAGDGGQSKLGEF